MKRIVLFVLMTAIIGTAAQAQTNNATKDHKEVKKDHNEWDKKVKDELKLTDEQVAKYDALNTEYKGKFDGLMQDATLTKDVQKERKMALKKEKEAKLFEFLTPEQQTRYRELVDKKMKEAQNKQGS